jgi:ribosomal protein S18 acetylase RimI-like enzyme
VDSGYVLRPAGPRDAAVIGELRARMFATLTPEGLDLSDFREKDARFLAQALGTERFLAWVAEDPRGEVVSCAALSVVALPPKPWNPSGRHGYISSMYTLPEHRRRGLGSRLLRLAVEKARAMGLDQAVLHASDAGRSVHEAAGFTATNEMRQNLKQSR